VAREVINRIQKLRKKVGSEPRQFTSELSLYNM